MVHADPRDRPENQTGVPQTKVTPEMIEEMVYRYVAAYDEEAPLGEPEFDDNVFNVRQLAHFLGRKIHALLSPQL
jgi:hypothetical protein